MQLPFSNRPIISLALLAALFVCAPSISSAAPSCKCRYAGKTVEVNTCVCLNMAAGPQMACCNMVINNTSWTFSQKSCPMSSLPLPLPMSLPGATVQTAAVPERIESSVRLDLKQPNRR